MMMRMERCRRILLLVGSSWAVSDDITCSGSSPTFHRGRSWTKHAGRVVQRPSTDSRRTRKRKSREGNLGRSAPRLQLVVVVIVAVATAVHHCE